MEPELPALAATAATTLVGLLTTDAWEKLKDGLGGLWRQAHPERAEAIEADITESRRELLTPSEFADDQLTSRLVNEWESRFYRFLLLNPNLAAPLRQLLNEAGLPGDLKTGTHLEHYDIRVKTSGHSHAHVVGKGVQWNGRRDE
jgi:hypothetical protein